MITANAGDLSNWMKEKASTLRGFKELLVTEIAMPGTHDALTYRLGKEKRADGKTGIAVKTPILGSAITKVAKAQGDNIIGQFANGSRYFDLRIAKTKNGFEGVHTLYNGPIEKSFRDFKDFLKKHPGEIVLMDINSIKSKHINEFMHLIKDIFGSMIYPRTKDRIKVTYQSLVSSGQRVIFFVNTLKKTKQI